MGRGVVIQVGRGVLIMWVGVYMIQVGSGILIMWIEV